MLCRFICLSHKYVFMSGKLHQRSLSKATFSSGRQILLSRIKQYHLHLASVNQNAKNLIKYLFNTMIMFNIFQNLTGNYLLSRQESKTIFWWKESNKAPSTPWSDCSFILFDSKTTQTKNLTEKLRARQNLHKVYIRQHPNLCQENIR